MLAIFVINSRAATAMVKERKAQDQLNKYKVALSNTNEKDSVSR